MQRHESDLQGRMLSICVIDGNDGLAMGNYLNTGGNSL